MSERDRELLRGRKIVSEIDADGLPIRDVMALLQQAIEKNGDDLKVGYWEYGDKIVVTKTHQQDPE